MRMMMRLLALLVMWAILTEAQGQQPLKLAAWNIQRLGTSKMSKNDIVNCLVKVIRRYDVLVVMETVDKSLTVPGQLHNELNNGLNPTDTYMYDSSSRMGITTYQEQYVFYWKPSRVKWVQSYTFNDLGNQFTYDPFGAVFIVNSGKNTLKFGMIAIHVSPKKAVKEIDALVDVYSDFKQKTGVDDVIIAGDFNAGGSYVSNKDWVDIRLRTDPKFTWLIPDNVGTTTTGSNAPYDRIVVAGKGIYNALNKNSAGPYDFKNYCGITNLVDLKHVSDHYPVEVSMQ
ncbi:deoxyribonuclease-1-like [Homarus americanus]|uniref:Deoxyribonuclease n=1 Tax=Homarus americanus TaxID=6706 RepID=A0A8J5JPK0_HOMAM|nr:deoxyribonuclease-1-like [Homarus americanus]XP_042203060.1 deoxyribonuclease-1-like [Homarus americanus]KAG7156909.1 deoxyribonuclease-1-like [Homarus americanus]